MDKGNAMIVGGVVLAGFGFTGIATGVVYKCLGNKPLENKSKPDGVKVVQTVGVAARIIGETCDALSTSLRNNVPSYQKTTTVKRLDLLPVSESEGVEAI